MKRSMFNGEHILKEQEAGMATEEACHRHGISSARSTSGSEVQWAGEVFEAQRLRSLQEENPRLKKLLAEAMFDNTVLKDLASRDGDARR